MQLPFLDLHVSATKPRNLAWVKVKRTGYNGRTVFNIIDMKEGLIGHIRDIQRTIVLQNLRCPVFVIK